MHKVLTYGPSIALLVSASWAWVSLHKEGLGSSVMASSGAPSDPQLGATVTAEGSFHEGLLDLCPGDPPYVQSRTGEYVTLHTTKSASAR